MSYANQRRLKRTARKLTRRTLRHTLGLPAIVLLAVLLLYKYLLRYRALLGRTVQWVDCKYNNSFAQLSWKLVGSSDEQNQADRAAIARLLAIFSELDLNKESQTVLVGGTNAGQLSLEILSLCPELTFHGFEIQKSFYLETKSKLKNFSHVHVHNLGWSDEASDAVNIAGPEGETAGLYVPKGQRGFHTRQETVSTVKLSAWAALTGITEVLYLVIDTEGHEPKVIRGMELENPANRVRFPMFQYELGGTWAERDNRHGRDPWTQYTTAYWLESLDYDLFMVGPKEWLYVKSQFFQLHNNPAALDEGYGQFVQGNVLALHRQAHRDLRRSIFERSSARTCT